MIVIRPMEEAERTQVALFVDRIMRKEYHCSAHILPEKVFVGITKGEVVGAMAITTSDGKRFPLEEIYDLDYNDFPELFDRSEIVQLGRWTATVPGIGAVLAYAAIRHALRIHCKWAVGEVKPKIARLYSCMGLKLFPLSGKLVAENISSEVRPYYSTPPAPVPCLLTLRDAERKLWEIVGPKLLRNKMELRGC